MRQPRARGDDFAFTAFGVGALVPLDAGVAAFGLGGCALGAFALGAFAFADFSVSVRRARGGLRPTFSAANALGQASVTGHAAHAGERAAQIRRPWKMSVCESMSQSSRGKSSMSSASIFSGVVS